MRQRTLRKAQVEQIDALKSQASYGRSDKGSQLVSRCRSCWRHHLFGVVPADESSAERFADTDTPSLERGIGSCTSFCRLRS